MLTTKFYPMENKFYIYKIPASMTNSLYARKMAEGMEYCKEEVDIAEEKGKFTNFEWSIIDLVRIKWGYTLPNLDWD